MAIQGLTPLQSSYQGNPQQQQVSAAMAPSSSSMGNGDIIVLGGVAATLLIGGLVACTQLGTSSTKKPPTSQVPPTPVQESQTPQIKSTPELTEEIPSPQSTSQPTPLSPPPLSPLAHGQSRPGKTLAGFIDDSGIYRERQEKGDGLCGLCALNTILYEFFGEEGIITKEELIEKFGKEIVHKGLSVARLMQLAEEKGLEVKPYDAEEFFGKSITEIDDAKAFIILKPRLRTPFRYHYVAMVRRKGFHLSDSWDQKEGDVYPAIREGAPCTATKGLFDYQQRSKVTARGVFTFRKRVPDHGPERGVHKVLRY